MRNKINEDTFYDYNVEESKAEETIISNPQSEETVIYEPKAEKTIISDPQSEETIVEEPKAEETIAGNQMVVSGNKSVELAQTGKNEIANVDDCEFKLDFEQFESKPKSKSILGRVASTIGAGILMGGVSVAENVIHDFIFSDEEDITDDSDIVVADGQIDTTEVMVTSDTSDTDDVTEVIVIPDETDTPDETDVVLVPVDENESDVVEVSVVADASDTSSWNDGVLPVSEGVSDNMSFIEAFKTARSEVGAGGLFEWRGNVYNTYYADEWNSLSESDQEEFVSHLTLEETQDDIEIFTVDDEADVPPLELENDVRTLGVFYDEFNDMNVGVLQAGDREILYFDEDKDNEFDFVGEDINDDGVLTSNELCDISDLGLPLESFLADEMPDDMMDYTADADVSDMI